MKQISALAGAFGCAALFFVLAAPRPAEACETTGTGWGDFWIERDGADCQFFARQYGCAADVSGNHTDFGVTLLDTLSGDASIACEDLAGYSDTVDSILAIYAPGSGGYECDSTFTDGDGDRVGACLDSVDDDTRLWVQTATTSEWTCDGVDNDFDTEIDDGLTGCTIDRIPATGRATCSATRAMRATGGSGLSTSTAPATSSPRPR